jgi:hypothetical protein
MVRTMSPEGPNKPKLIFVYNADSGIINTVTDYFHKIVKPSTYQCNLCALTFNNLGMKSVWKEFVNGLKVDVEFLHKDEFAKEYDFKDAEFPSGFLKAGNDLKLYITAEEINKCKTLDDLMDLVTEKVNQI